MKVEFFGTAEELTKFFLVMTDCLDVEDIENDEDGGDNEDAPDEDEEKQSPILTVHGYALTIDSLKELLDKHGKDGVKKLIAEAVEDYVNLAVSTPERAEK